MKGLFLKQIRRKRTATFLFLVSILLIATALPISITSIQQSQKQVETDITYYARGSYDLLVRPKGVKHPLEDKLGIVPENYIGFGSGGISVAQWEEIKNREDIEIAAPVASLGYFSGLKTTLALFPPEHDYNRYLFQFYTSDGKNEYAFGPEYACFILKNDLSDSGSDKLFNNPDLLNYCTDKISMYPMVPTYHLLVGIDPIEEEKLTGISFSGINPDAPKMGWGTMYARDLPNATAIPVISVIDSRQTLLAKFSIDKLDLTQEDIEIFRERVGLPNNNEDDSYGFISFTSQHEENEYQQLINYLLTIEEIQHDQYEVNLSSLINPFKQSDSGIYINKEGEVSQYNEDVFGQKLGYYYDMDLTHSMKYYRAGYVHYEEENGQLKVKIIGEEDGVPIYRQIEQVGEILKEVENLEEVKFVLDPVDAVEIGEKSKQLASSPLGIYQFAPVRYIGDGEENAIQLQPTVTPGSFVSAPAEGLTNIQSAELIKGDKPIDAIRVKVAGISGYTKEAAEKIEQVAEDIRKMGLDVTVVAGASPQKLKVEVEGVGLVEESWTTLGAAGTIVREWNVTNVFLSVMFVLVALTYILNRMLYWEVNNKSDIVLMHQLGWKEKHILHLSRQEVLFLVLVGSILSVPILTAFTLSNMSGTQLFINYGISVLVLILFIYLFVTLKVRKVFKDKPDSQKMRKTGKGKSLVWKNLVYFRKHILPSFIQITMLALLSSFVYISLSTTAELTGITLLGEYINLQINPYTMTILIITYSITIFTLTESLLSLMKSREAEITTFRQLGWKFAHIYRLYMKEVVVWSGVATILGSGTSAVLFNSLYPLTTKAASVIVVSMVSLYVLVLLVSGIILFYQLKRRLGTSKIVTHKDVGAVDVTM